MMVDLHESAQVVSLLVTALWTGPAEAAGEALPSSPLSSFSPLHLLLLILPLLSHTLCNPRETKEEEWHDKRLGAFFCQCEMSFSLSLFFSPSPL